MTHADDVTITDCTCTCLTEDLRSDPTEICPHPDCRWGEEPDCPYHGQFLSAKEN